VPPSPPRKSDQALDAELAARAHALALVEAALSRRAGIDEAAASPGAHALEPRQRAFARAIALLVLRRLVAIDRLLDARLQKPPPEPVRNLLRLGAAQLLYMETPDFAAVNTTVELAARRNETRPFKGLINAVLRRLVRERPEDTGPLAPDWLHARWRATYGAAGAEAIAAEIPREPPTDLSLKPGLDAEDLAASLEARVLPGGSLRTERRGDVAEWPGYQEGGWWIQDAAAAIPVRLLDVREGESAVDLCAAPGGKTLQLAAAGAEVVAVDRSAARLRRVTENLQRTGLGAETVAADAGAWDDPRTFDAVLLDAPCSATGTFRRHPDVLWAARPGDVAKLSEVQARLLDSAARRVRPGGRLVYCVCSLEPEEGEAQAAGFLKRHPEFARHSMLPGEGGAPEEALTPGRRSAPPAALLGRAGRHGRLLRRAVRSRGLKPNCPQAGRPPHPARLATKRLTDVTLTYGASRSHHRAVPAVGRLRPPGERGPGHRGGGRRLAAPGRDGRPFRAEPHHRPRRHQGAEAPLPPAVRRAPDGGGARPLPGGLSAAGADILSVHPEAGAHTHRTLRRIRELGAKAGLVLKPGHSGESAEWVLEDLDLILVMSVNPGFGGQAFIPGQLKKIARLREMIDASGRDIILEVDGGVNPETARRCLEAGATALVAGAAVFGRGSDNYAGAITALRGG
jgi:16S rRNA (cytosine967-C5)-methyltransferase